MNKTALFFVPTLIFFLIEGVSLAGYLDQEYNDMDADENGYIDWEEFRFYEKGATPESFRKIDENSDDKIEYREWISYRDKDYPFESKYKNRECDFLYYECYPKYSYRYYDPFPRYGFRFHYGHGSNRRHRLGFGFHLGNRYYPRYEPHHYRYRHYYGYRHFVPGYHYRSFK